MVLGSKSAPHSLSYSVQKELDDKSCCWERVMAHGKGTHSTIRGEEQFSHV